MSETSTRAAFLIATAVLAGCGGDSETVAPPPDFSRAITVERLRNDPAYTEQLAREELGWVREGDTVLKFPSQK